MAYQHITFAQLQQELLNRLDDYGGVYWTVPEVGLYLQEALRTWQALTQFWRNRMTFNTSANIMWYDLTQQGGTLIPYTLKDSDLVSVMLYQLIEPQLSLGTYFGSDMFTLADFTKAMERRRNQFLLETGMVTSQSIINAPAPPANRVPLADSVIDVRRASWIDVNSNYSTLWKADEWGSSAFQVNWETSPTTPPVKYSVAASPPVTLQLIPPSGDVGRIELITVNTGATLNPTAGVLLGIPDDFAWVVKWGAMADLLGREGQPKDAQRSQYCEARWREGIALGRIHTSIVNAQINGQQVFTTNVHNLSTYRSGWQNLAPTVPDTLALMSWNLLAANPTPDNNGPYSITVDIVQNCPVPVAAGDQVQIGREELDVILDYAQHVASFKQGGQEFMATVPLYQNMIRLAQLRNGRLKAAIPFYEPMSDRALTQEKESSRVAQTEEVT